MATGRRPFEEKLSTALANAIIKKPPEPPSSHNRKVSPGLESIILKALDKIPIIVTNRPERCGWTWKG